MTDTQLLNQIRQEMKEQGGWSGEERQRLFFDSSIWGASRLVQKEGSTEPMLRVRMIFW